MKYIVRNCPAMDNDDITCQDCSCNECGMVACIERTDCVLKRIVERADLCLCPEVVELLEIEECEC